MTFINVFYALDSSRITGWAFVLILLISWLIIQVGKFAGRLAILFTKHFGKIGWIVKSHRIGNFRNGSGRLPEKLCGTL